MSDSVANPGAGVLDAPAPAAGRAAEPRPRRSGAGLFSLYRTLGTPDAQAPAEAAPAAGALSRAARLLGRQHAPGLAAPAADDASRADQPAEEAPPPESTDRRAEGEPRPEDIVAPPAQATAPGAVAQTDAAAADDHDRPRPPPAPAGARGLRRPARRSALPSAGLDQRLADARQRKLLKRRVRGEDYEQVTVILDRPLYLELDRRLAALSARSGGVKLSRSMFVRALLRRFLLDNQPLSWDGLFTPDPRAPDELEVLEAALIERLKPAQG